MDRLLAKNLDSIASKDPELAVAIQESDTTAYQVIEGKRGCLTLQKGIGKDALLFHSLYDPEQEADMLVQEKNVAAADLLIVLGFGLGYHIHKALQLLSKDAPVVIAEKDLGLLKAAFQKQDFSYILGQKKCFLIAGEGRENALIRDIAEWVKPRRSHLKNWVVLALSAAMQTGRSFYTKILQDIRDGVMFHTVIQGTKTYMEPNWPGNVALNIEHIFESMRINDLKGAFPNVPLFLLAAGPSLELEFTYLNEAREKGILCAVGTAYRVLLKRGIIPHFVLSVDAGPLNLKHFEGTENEQSYLIYDPVIYPKILERAKEKKVVALVSGLESDVPLQMLIGELGDFGVVEAGLSVATMGLGLTRLFQCDPLVLIGQDLSFPHGKTHAEGTALYRKLDFDERAPLVPANNGKMVTTSKTWIATRTYFEKRIHYLSAKVFNTSKLGAKISGAEFVPLEKLLKQFPKQQIEAELSKRYSVMESNADAIHRLRDSFQETLNKLESLKEEAERGRKDAEEFYLTLLRKDKAPQTLVDRTQERLDRLGNDPVRAFVAPFFHETEIYLEKSGANKPKDADPRLWEVNRAGIFFEGLLASCEKGIEVAATAVEKLEAVLKKKIEGIA